MCYAASVFVVCAELGTCRLPFENSRAVQARAWEPGRVQVRACAGLVLGHQVKRTAPGALTFSPLCTVLLLQVPLRRPQPEHARQLRLQPGLPLRRRPPAQHRLRAKKEEKRARVICAGLPSGRRGRSSRPKVGSYPPRGQRNPPWGDQVANLRSRFLGGAFPELIAMFHFAEPFPRGLGGGTRSSASGGPRSPPALPLG